MLQDALVLQDAGCFSLVLEAVPARLAELISQRLQIPTVGIGAGLGCDGQVLVTHDIVGLFDRFTPKFVKQYVKINETISTAISEYKSDVENGRFPEEKHGFTIKTDELEKV